MKCSSQSSAILMLVLAMFAPHLNQPVKHFGACLKFRVRALLDSVSFEQTWVSTLSVPSDTLLWWAGSVYLYQVLCTCGKKTTHIMQKCTSPCKTYMYYNHAFTTSLYHYPECIDCIIITGFINNFFCAVGISLIVGCWISNLDCSHFCKIQWYFSMQ